MPSLRSAQGSDLEALVELSRELADHDIALGQRRPLRWDTDPTPAIQEALANPAPHRFTVVVDEHDDVIGSCRTALMGEDHPCGAHVHDLIVREPFRGQGLGRALLDDALAWCAEQGVDEVCLGVAPLSTRSRRFYEQYGFEEVSVLVVKRLEA